MGKIGKQYQANRSMWSLFIFTWIVAIVAWIWSTGKQGINGVTNRLGITRAPASPRFTYDPGFITADDFNHTIEADETRFRYVIDSNTDDEQEATLFTQTVQHV